MTKFLYQGENVTIHQYAKIVKPEMISIGDNSTIDDFVFMNGGQGIKIGRYVHIASFTSIIGDGKLEIGNYVGIACGSRFITGTNTYKEGKRMSASLPLEQQGVMRGKIVIKEDAFIGTNVVIHPNVTIGKGAIIGSNSLVLKNIRPWTINIGNPTKEIGKRPKVLLPII